jgi:hypothetical protein
MANATMLPCGDTLAPCALTVAPPGGVAAVCETTPALPFTCPAGAPDEAVELSGDELPDTMRLPFGLLSLRAPKAVSLAGALASYAYLAV